MDITGESPESPPSGTEKIVTELPREGITEVTKRIILPDFSVSPSPVKQRRRGGKKESSTATTLLPSVAALTPKTEEGKRALTAQLLLQGMSLAVGIEVDNRIQKGCSEEAKIYFKEVGKELADE